MPPEPCKQQRRWKKATNPTPTCLHTYIHKEGIDLGKEHLGWVWQPSSIFWMLRTLFRVSLMKEEASFIRPRDSKSLSVLPSLFSKMSMPMVREFRGLRSS